AVQKPDEKLQKEGPRRRRAERKDDLRRTGEDESPSEEQRGDGGGRQRINDHDGADCSREDAHEKAPSGLLRDFLRESSHCRFSPFSFFVLIRPGCSPAA